MVGLVSFSLKGLSSRVPHRSLCKVLRRDHLETEAKLDCRAGQGWLRGSLQTFLQSTTPWHSCPSKHLLLFKMSLFLPSTDSTNPGTRAPVTTEQGTSLRAHLLPVGRDDTDVPGRHLAGDTPGQQAAVAHDLDSLGGVEPRRASSFTCLVALS